MTPEQLLEDVARTIRSGLACDATAKEIARAALAVALKAAAGVAKENRLSTEHSFVGCCRGAQNLTGTEIEKSILSLIPKD